MNSNNDRFFWIRGEGIRYSKIMKFCRNHTGYSIAHVADRLARFSYLMSKKVKIFKNHKHSPNFHKKRFLEDFK